MEIAEEEIGLTRSDEETLERLQHENYHRLVMTIDVVMSRQRNFANEALTDCRKKTIMLT